jgi:hypothetical protein
MRIPPRLLTAACLLCAIVASSDRASAQATLRWKFQPEQRFVVTCTQETEVETSINNKPRRAFLEMGMEMAWHVTAVDSDGVATITQSFERLQTKTTAPESDPVIYDSNSTSRPTGPAKEVAASLAPLHGAAFVITMDPRGEVKKVTIDDETQAALDKLPSGSQLEQVLTPEGLTNLFRLGGGQLPEKAVSVGDSWPVNSETPTPYGVLQQEGTLTYVGQEKVGDKQLEKIELKSVAKLAPKKDAAVKLDMQEQTKAGVLLFDSDAGQAISSETRLVSKSVRPFRDTQIQIKIQGTTKLEIKAK